MACGATLVPRRSNILFVVVFVLFADRWLSTRRSATQLIVQRAGSHLGLLLGSD
eukprot:COSAG02_NODE_11338_length_1744_cov_1.147720_1_plen_53_part_10